MELIKRGWQVGNYNASTKNASSYDLFASKGKRRIGIRVKSYTTSKSRSAENVQYTAKTHGSAFNNIDLSDNGDFAVIVRISFDEPEQFHIIPTKIVDKALNKSHKAWNSYAKKDGTPRKNTNRRVIFFTGTYSERTPHRGYEEVWKKYKNNWEILE
jgi:hypothetical protein